MMANNLVEHKIKADRWDKLVKLADSEGEVFGNSIHLFQDDATGNYLIKVGTTLHYGSSFAEALSKFEVEDD